MESYIYVIGAQTGPVKIGFSKDPLKRLRQLQTGHAAPLVLHYAEAVASDRVRVMERLIHDQVKRHKLTGEWFDLKALDAIAEIAFAVIRYDAEPDLAARHRRGTLRR